MVAVVWQHWPSTDGEVEAGEAEEAELAQQPLVAVSRRGEERTVAGAGAGGGGGGAGGGRGGAAAASAGGRLVARLGRPLAALQHRVAQQARQRHRQQRQAAHLWPRCGFPQVVPPHAGSARAPGAWS